MWNMSNTFYLETIIDEMNDLLVAIATGRASLQGGDANEKYCSLRRKLIDLAPLIGGIAPLIEQAADGWQFWKIVSDNRGTYQERRAFIAKGFSGYYKQKLESSQNLSLSECLIRRDLLLENEIGRGGFGTVYKATHISLESSRAVKAFDPSFYSGEDKPFRRFAREAELLANLTHPGIVRFYDAGIAGKQPFIVTEYLPDMNLQALINDIGILPEITVIEVCKQILEAIEAAHQKGVFHRDIKPSNLIWDWIHVKILDFGSGTALTNAITSRMTTTAVGTPGYIAPELLDDPTILHPGPDLYSIGVTAHYMLTGRSPYPSDSTFYLRSQNVSEGFASVITRSLLPIDDRFQTARKMIEAIEAVKSFR
jgi:serine/threonine-protein kinase